MIFILLLLATNLSFAEPDIDPFEDFNRSTYKFNQTLDEHLLKPTAEVYQKNVPKVAQTSVSNFFGNLSDISTLANQILQFKPIESAQTFGRVLLNSTVGLGGFLDVASDVDLTTDHEDFGQTLAVWGAEEGPYIVLPLLGPSNIRDSVGFVTDANSPSNAINQLDIAGTIGAGAINLVNKRVKLSPLIEIVNQSEDAYITARSSYLQKRKFDIYDGNLPEIDEF